jgi:hypothetical protein
MKRFVASALLLACTACVSGSKIRAESEVIQADVERARRSGALRCAPVELATAEANLDFAKGELSQGSSFRASEHIRIAEDSIKKALALSKDCGPTKVVVRERPDQPKPPDTTHPRPEGQRRLPGGGAEGPRQRRHRRQAGQVPGPGRGPRRLQGRRRLPRAGQRQRRHRRRGGQVPQ